MPPCARVIGGVVSAAAAISVSSLFLGPAGVERERRRKKRLENGFTECARTKVAARASLSEDRPFLSSERSIGSPARSSGSMNASPGTLVSGNNIFGESGPDDDLADECVDECDSRDWCGGAVTVGRGDAELER